MKFLLAAAVSLALAACTKPNPEVCCTSAGDCSSIGVSDPSRDCARGLTCQDHSCVVPTCTTSADCSGNAPVCTDGVCVACDAADACITGLVCELDSGACVGCLVDSDCSAAQPVCDMLTSGCRACVLDSECSSGACDNGTCVVEDAIAYVDPVGSDTGNCTHDAPCQSINGAALKTNDGRPHIVIAKATYAGPVRIRFDAVTATHMVLHGSRATIQCADGADGECLGLGRSVTLRDLSVSAPGGDGISLGSSDPNLLERVSIQAVGNGLLTNQITNLNDVDIVAGGSGILTNAGQQLTFDRGTISGGVTGIHSINGGPTIQLSNLVIFGTSDRAIDLPSGIGTISFTTIANAGSATTSVGGKAVECSSSLTLRASIVWVPGGTRPAVENCNVEASIIGPIGIAGGLDVDPMFVNADAHDYHLMNGSPAIDQVITGPASDFEGDPRPQGARFDIGADEAKP